LEGNRFKPFLASNDAPCWDRAKSRGREKEGGREELQVPLIPKNGEGSVIRDEKWVFEREGGVFT